MRVSLHWQLVKGSYYLSVSCFPTRFKEGQRSSINVCLGPCCDLLIHPVDDVPFVPDDRTRTQLDLLGEGSVAYAGIGEGLAHTSPLNYPGKEEEAWGPMSKNEVGWSLPDRPT